MNTSPEIKQEIVKKLFNSEANEFFRLDERVFEKSYREVQLELAPLLRQITIDHLKKADTRLTRDLKRAHEKSSNISYDTYLDGQRRLNGVWGSDDEAEALAEVLGFTLMKLYDRFNPHEPWEAYSGKDGMPTIHLHNYSNVHWSNNRGETIGDGNCLYNSFAKELKYLICPQEDNLLQKDKSLQKGGSSSKSSNTTQNSIANKNKTSYASNSKKPSPLIQGGIFSSANKEILESQMRISNSISDPSKSSKTPLQRDIERCIEEREERRIQRLPENEQKQITEDYQLALKLAKEEMLKEKKSIFQQTYERASNTINMMMR